MGGWNYLWLWWKVGCTWVQSLWTAMHLRCIALRHYIHTLLRQRQCIGLCIWCSYTFWFFFSWPYGLIMLCFHLFVVLQPSFNVFWRTLASQPECIRVHRDFGHLLSSCQRCSHLSSVSGRWISPHRKRHISFVQRFKSHHTDWQTSWLTDNSAFSIQLNWIAD